MDRLSTSTTASTLVTRVLAIGGPDWDPDRRPYRVIGTTDGVFLAVGWLAEQGHSDMIGFLVQLHWRQDGERRVLVSPPRAPEPYGSTTAWQEIRAHQARARRAVARRRRSHQH